MPVIRLRSRLLPALALVTLLMSLIDNFQGWRFLSLFLAGAWLVGFLWARSLARNLHIKREMRFGWAQVGDRIEERFTLTNTGSFPGLWVELVDHSSLPQSSANRIVGVELKSAAHWRIQRVCQRRGLYTLGPTSLRSGDPFGLYSVEIHHPGYSSLLVTPPIVPLPQIQVAPGGRIGEGRPRTHAPERTVSAYSVRQYSPGDPLQTIHWRTTARRDELFVRMFESTPSSDWWIFLDLDQAVQVGEEANATHEHAIILAASLADRGLSEKQPVGLVANGDELVWLPPMIGEVHRWDILQSLARISTGARPLAELLSRARPRLERQASLVIITPSQQAAWIEALIPLLRRGAIPTVLLFDLSTFGASPGNQAAFGLLHSLGISTALIPRQLLDRPEAHPGSQGQWEWLTSATGRAIPLRQPKDADWRAIA
jgi:uncharacterized protein (DUF58 family)